MFEETFSKKYLEKESIKNFSLIAYKNLSVRCLTKSAAWFAEINYTIKNVQASSSSIEIHGENQDTFALARCYFDLKEYDRASNLLKNQQDSLSSFLHHYSKYQALNYKSNPCFKIPSINNGEDSFENEEGFALLYQKLNNFYIQGNIDGFHLYLLGILLKKECKAEAKGIFVKSIQDVPYLWASWLELVCIIDKTEEISKLNLPDIWIKDFFMAQHFVQQNQWEEALQIYRALENCGFKDNPHVCTNIANILFQMREMEESMKVFREKQLVDPYCLDNFDIYSNVLYVLEKEEELCNLAHTCQDVDPLRPESCCVIGNFYSLRGERLKAIVYFQRALTLNPNFYTAWILIGHEYNELKNMSAAITAYHKALEIKPNDYRAWNGFGITYEILNMPAYSLYYYQKAHLLNPSDSRLLMAIGDAYEKLGKYSLAKKCYQKAVMLGDDEDSGLFKLAEVCAILNDTDTAVVAYTKYMKEAEILNIINGPQQAKAIKFLGLFYLNTGDVEKAYKYFEKGLKYLEAAEDSKAMLENISKIYIPKF